MLEQLLDERNPSISGIIAGVSKGRVWLFGEKDPVFAVVYSYCVGGFGLTGRIKTEYVSKVKEVLDQVLNEGKAEGNQCFEFSAEEKLLYDQIFQLYPDKSIHSEMEYSYRLTRSYENLPYRMGDFSIRKVDEQFFKELFDGKYLNSQMFVERYKNSWGSAQQFLVYSRAFLVLKESEVVGIIFGSSRYQDIITVDIEVDATYRNQGLASMLVYHMLNDCSNDYITLQWDHVESNTASRCLAEKMGFHLVKSRPYYWFEL